MLSSELKKKKKHWRIQKGLVTLVSRTGWLGNLEWDLLFISELPLLYLLNCILFAYVVFVL